MLTDVARDTVSELHRTANLATGLNGRGRLCMILDLPAAPRALSSDVGDTGGMWIGWIEFDLLLGDVRSLKAKRSVVRPIIADVRKKFQVSVAEVGYGDLHRRTALGVAVVSADPAHLTSVLDDVERLVASKLEIELLSAHRSLISSEDE